MVLLDELTLDTKFTLNNGVQIPALGIGTFQTQVGNETKNAVLYALEAGYRHIDTAEVYGNEMNVGEAIKLSGIPREEIFIATKVWNSNHGYKPALSAFEKSLKRLDTSYIDLYLIHWPEEGLRMETWRALETLLNHGKCWAIGVSNYMIWHVKEILEQSLTIPVINQVEFSPYLYQKDLLDFFESNKIKLEAYSPLTRGSKLNDPKLINIARKYSKSPAQILIRWALQHAIVVIPKSKNRDRIYENADVFDFSITPGDMRTLDAFDEGLRIGWDPSQIK